ncbi:MAG: acyl transferase [Chitinophagaceae bacterium]|nr:acyl transferase [Chitinophagaceae bacterium]
MEKIFTVQASNFEEVAIAVFQYQYQHCNIYKQFINAIHVNANSISTISEIPFLPISFFKTHQVACGEFSAELIFKSSGTTSQNTAKHFIKEKEIYITSFYTGITQFYNNINNTCILGLLPSYIENGDSSLVFMVDYLIKNSTNKDSGIYLYDTPKLKSVLAKNTANNIPTIFIGVTYALLQFAQEHPLAFNDNIIIMETGGMKGRGREMTRMEVHQILKEAFQIKNIHSEYGMTELLSQAYSNADGIFKCSNTMQILVRDFNDPLQTALIGKGALNIIDLANVHSCSFIATQDVGEVYTNGSFLVNGRMDASDVRGCNMLV